MSTAVCSCSLCLGVLIFASQNENLDYLQYIMFLIIAFINTLLIILILYHLLEGYINQFDDKLDVLRTKLKLKYPNIEFQFPCLRKLLINKKEMKEKVTQYWSRLRYETREGIKRRRNDKTAPLFYIKENNLYQVLKIFQIKILKLNNKIQVYNKIIKHKVQL